MGYAWDDHLCMTRIFLPIPFNVIARMLRDAFDLVRFAFILEAKGERLDFYRGYRLGQRDEREKLLTQKGTNHG